ncbi:MAG: acyl-CoA dehydrogenase family protein [Candidatus Sericytochromatia bacterium]|nr:acyl-CoA dehydrogenase family protein [Candidatus Sericytochromatia bacterium]
MNAQLASPATDPGFQQTLQDVIAVDAQAVDVEGRYPRRALEALARAGWLGLVSAREVGGMGLGHRAAAEVVRAIAERCGTTAMVVCMHYCGAAVIEAHGPREVREAIARGEHVSTLAFSEVGSRSMFWAPQSSAVAVEDGVALDADKSWITSAGEADSYVWSSRPLAADAPSTIWLVDAKAPGLTVAAPFDGLGLRGNASSPVQARGVRVREADRLGPDGGGFDVMMGIVLPYFNVMNAAVSCGLMEAALRGAAAHAATTSYTHLRQALADMPTVRAQLARARVQADQAWLLVLDTVAALEGGREDAMLRVLEVKAAAGDAALGVTDAAMRVGGGAAFRKEVGVERAFRDARASSVMAPTADALYDFIGKAVCGLPLFG